MGSEREGRQQDHIDLVSHSENLGFYSERNRKPLKRSKQRRDIIGPFYKGSDGKAAGIAVKTTDRRLLQKCRPGMKATWVKAVGRTRAWCSEYIVSEELAISW